jgi:hypothetical protein
MIIGSHEPTIHHWDLNQAENSCPLEAVNGVPVAVEHIAIAAVKGEPVVAVRVESKWTSHSVTASDPVQDNVTSV